MYEKALIPRKEPTPEYPPMSVAEFAKRLGLTRASAYKVLTHEPGVLRINTPGSTKAIIRVPYAVYERILRRAAIPA